MKAQVHTSSQRWILWRVLLWDCALCHRRHAQAPRWEGEVADHMQASHHLCLEGTLCFHSKFIGHHVPTSGNGPLGEHYQLCSSLLPNHLMSFCSLLPKEGPHLTTSQGSSHKLPASHRPSLNPGSLEMHSHFNISPYMVLPGPAIYELKRSVTVLTNKKEQ